MHIRTILQSARLCRYFCLNALRVVSFLLIVFGVIKLIQSILLAYSAVVYRQNSFFDPESWLISYSDAYMPFGSAWGMLIPGVIIGVLSKRISKWIFPYPDYVCLGCGYSLDRRENERCPECGRSVAEKREEKG